MKKRGLKFKGERQNEEMSLQITSMADIFTIILVFLLKTFSTGLATISPAQGMVLPSVSASVQDKGQMKDALKLEILASAILVDQKAVVSMKDFVLPSFDQQTLVSEPVLQALRNEQEKTKAASGSTQSNLLVLADERTPYSTLKTVMASAASAGYIDLQLVVMKAE